MTDELIGTRLGQYELIELIRRGGMATVYKAHQASLDRFVAVKVLFHGSDPQFALRFKREARAIAQLQHPNILPIYDYGEQDGLLFLALQLVENGVTLTDLIATAVQPMEAVAVLKLIRRLLSALEYAHRRGIIHRDIKPSNVLMPEPDWPMLADFGIAKLLNDNTEQLTMPGFAVGTVAYMAPEQALAQTVDARTDLYSMGVLLYELLTGRVPFEAEQPLAVLTKHAYERPQPPRLIYAAIPPAVDQVVLRALEKRPGDRYQTAAEMSAALEEIIVQLQRSDNRGQLTGLYHDGLLAFSEGRWAQAIEQLSKLVEIDPEYEDSADLLAAAHEASQQVRAEARAQIERVRQQRSSVAQQNVAAIQPDTPPTVEGNERSAAPLAKAAIGETTHLPAGEAITGETTRMPASVANEAGRIEEPQPATSSRVTGQPANLASREDRPTAPNSARISSVEPVPSSSTPSARRRLPIVIGAVVVLLLAVVAIAFAVLRPIRPTTSAPTAVAATDAASTVGSVPTGAGAPAETLPAPLGTLVFEDNFEAGPEKSGLLAPWAAPDLILSIDSSSYTMGLVGSDASRPILLPRLAVGDFSLQIDLADISANRDGDAAQGVVFRARSVNQFYALLIDSRKGRYSVFKQDGETSRTTLISGSAPQLTQQGGEQLRLDAQGDSFTMYLNATRLGSFRDDSFASGMLGTIVVNADAGESLMQFDNLRIWSNDQAPARPTLPATIQDAIGSDMVLIPGGEFIMGSNDDPNALPHIVSLSDFYIDRKEVTNVFYFDCVHTRGCALPKPLDSATRQGYFGAPDFNVFPVINVTWAQANEFCTKHNKRLPTEAEWEKAASWNRATQTKQIWPWGNTFDPERLNSTEGGRGDTTQVGTFASGLNDIFDMAGNVAEWTSSRALPYPYNPGDGREDPQAGGDRVVRGGSWGQPADASIASARQPADPATISNQMGFRCVSNP